MESLLHTRFSKSLDDTFFNQFSVIEILDDDYSSKYKMIICKLLIKKLCIVNKFIFLVNKIAP